MFEGLSLKQIKKKNFMEGENPTLRESGGIEKNWNLLAQASTEKNKYPSSYPSDSLQNCNSSSAPTY